MRRLPFLLAIVAAPLAAAMPASAHTLGGTPVAIVTAETANEVLAVALPGGQVLRRVHLHDPQTVTAQPSGPAAVVSPTGTVTLLAWRTLRPIAIFRGFRSPQLAAFAPDGEWLYVTDAGTGDVTVIVTAHLRVVARVFVGRRAHHLAFSPDERRLWVALGERARTIVVLDTSRPNRPRVLRRLRLPVPVHDLAFAPDGQTVWATSATTPYTLVLDSSTGRVIARVRAGPPPQHVVFVPYGKPRILITSGYGSSLELVDAVTRKILRQARLPYGSFNVAASAGIVVTTSLLDGTVTELAGLRLAPWLTERVAPAARSVAISVW